MRCADVDRNQDRQALPELLAIGCTFRGAAEWFVKDLGIVLGQLAGKELCDLAINCQPSSHAPWECISAYLNDKARPEICTNSKESLYSTASFSEEGLEPSQCDHDLLGLNNVQRSSIIADCVKCSP